MSIFIPNEINRIETIPQNRVESAFKKGKRGQMIIQVPENHLSIEVSFSTLNREPGFDDDIRIGFSKTRDREIKLFKGDTASFLITPEQAKQFAQALLEAAEQSQNEPKR